MDKNKVVPIVVSGGGKLPEYAHATDSGLDVYTSKSVSIYPGQTVIVPTGLHLADMESNLEVQLRPRSGISRKTNLSLVNSPSTIDEGYRGEIGVPIRNNDIDLVKYFNNYDRSYEVVDISKLDEEVGKLGYVDRDAPVIYYIPEGTRIVQMVFNKVVKVDLVEVDTTTESDRGSGAFGSSGVK